MRNLVGIAVECAKCGRTKAPHGRSVGSGAYGVYCQDDLCADYPHDPKPGCLWPGETSEEFGYDCCSQATREFPAPPEVRDEEEL